MQQARLTFTYNGETHTFPFKEGCEAGLTIQLNGPTLLGGYTEQELIAMCEKQLKTGVWLTSNEEAVLAALHSNSEYCMGYKGIEGTNKLEQKELKPIIKRLKELGLIEFWRGLMTEEGEVAGSGWCRSAKGNEYIEAHQL